MKMSEEEFMAQFPGHAVAKQLKERAGNSPKKSVAKPKTDASESPLEAEFAKQIAAMRLPVATRELKFHPERKWRFDFAWPDQMLAVELEGGIWGNGRHNRAPGFISDAEKYNAAAELGWTVLRFTGKHIRNLTAVDQVQSILASSSRADNAHTIHEAPRRPQMK